MCWEMVPQSPSSCSCCAMGEGSLMLDFGRRSSKPASVPSGTRTNKLLAKDMLQEDEVRRQSPGVIAKLMGLEGIPPPYRQSSGRSRRRQGEDLHVKSKVETAERSEYVSSRGSSRRRSTDELEFKDVFEVTDWSRLWSRDGLTPRTMEMDTREAEMVFTVPRFLDAKRLSTRDKRRDSQEFDNTLEVHDSNEDLFLKFLQQPDPFFANHTYGMQGTTFESSWRKNVSVRKPVDARDCSTISPGSKLLQEKVPGKHGISLKNCQNYVPSQTPIALDGSSYESTKRESPAAPYSFPTKIVVLKPHLGKEEDTPGTNFSPSGQSLFTDLDIPPEYFRVKSSETKMVDRKRNPDQSKKSRVIFEEVSRKARSTSCNIGSVSVPSSRQKGRAGDESSSDISLDEFSYDSDGEAKRRLSERWKLALKPCNKGEFSKGSTLAEMLAVPDRLVRCRDVHKVGQQGLKRVSATSAEPSGISSRDGWKDVGLGKLSRSRSLPSSSTLKRSAAPRYPRTSWSRHASSDFMETIPREGTRCVNHRPMEGKVDTLDRLATGGLKYSFSERISPSCRSCYGADASLESESTCGKIAFRPKEIVQSPPVAVLDETMVKPSPSNHSEASLQRLDSSAWFLGELLSKEPPRLFPENSQPAAHHSRPDPDTSTSSKEADQPSPVSVFEAPSADNFSCSSEYFESLSANLHGLRRQLELLKLESRAYAEGSEFISGDDSTDKGVFHFLEELDSPECPAGPLVFEELEKTYGSRSSSMSERTPMRLVTSQKNKAQEEALDKAFISNRKWLNVRNDINLIGKDLSNLLASELIRELLAK